MEKDKPGGFVGVTLENSDSTPTENRNNGLYLHDVAYVKVKMCKLRLHASECVYGCGIFVKGMERFPKEWSQLERIAKGLFCPVSKTCNFNSSYVFVEDTEFHGDIFTTGSVIYSQDTSLK